LSTLEIYSICNLNSKLAVKLQIIIIVFRRYMRRRY